MRSTLQRTASAFDRAAWAAQLAPLMKLWDSLAGSQPQMLHQAPQQQPASAASAAPLDAFVAQEAAAAHLLATAVHGSLASLKQTLAGTAVLTPAVQVSCMIAFTWDLELPCLQSIWQPKAAMQQPDVCLLAAACGAHSLELEHFGWLVRVISPSQATATGHNAQPGAGCQAANAVPSGSCARSMY